MMFREFSVKNFRGFRAVSVAPLDLVNLIAGANSVGKTALLEALFLHVGPHNPTLPLQINVLRGVPQAALDPARSWAWMFKNEKEPIELTSVDHKAVERTLRVRVAAQASAEAKQEPSETDLLTKQMAGEEITPAIPGSVTTALGPKELILDYADTVGKKAVARASLTEARDVMGLTLPRFDVPLGIFLTARARLHRDDVERFSNLDRLGLQGKVVRAVRIVEPRLKRLAVLLTDGEALIHGDVGIGQLLPVQLLGEGISRVASIVSAIASAPGGVVLVDEIENGLHYSVMVDVWKAIAAAARRSNTQVFATTHSRECIEAAHEAFTARRKYSFRLHRLERIRGSVQAITYDGASLSAALDAGLAVR